MNIITVAVIFFLFILYYVFNIFDNISVRRL